MSDRKNHRRRDRRVRSQATGRTWHEPTPPTPPTGPLDFTIGHAPRALRHERGLDHAASSGRALGANLAMVGAYVAHVAGDLADLDAAWDAIVWSEAAEIASEPIDHWHNARALMGAWS